MNKDQLKFRSRVAFLWLTGPVTVPVVLVWNALKEVPYYLKQIYKPGAAWAAFKAGQPIDVDNDGIDDGFTEISEEQLAELFAAMAAAKAANPEHFADDDNNNDGEKH